MASELWSKPTYSTVVAPSFIGALIGVDDMNLLQTLTAANSPTLTSTVSLSSTYDRYLIVLEAIIPGSSVAQTRLRINSGAGIQTTNYIGSVLQNTAGTDAATTFVPLTGTTTVLSTGVPGLYGAYYLWQPWDTTTPKMIQGNGGYWNGTNGINSVSMGFYNGTNNAVIAVELSMSSSNISSGTMKLYGIYGT